MISKTKKYTIFFLFFFIENRFSSHIIHSDLGFLSLHSLPAPFPSVFSSEKCRPLRDNKIQLEKAKVLISTLDKPTQQEERSLKSRPKSQKYTTIFKVKILMFLIGWILPHGRAVTLLSYNLWMTAMSKFQQKYQHYTKRQEKIASSLHVLVILFKVY